jgi:hypothetical protein
MYLSSSWKATATANHYCSNHGIFEWIAKLPLCDDKSRHNHKEANTRRYSSQQSLYPTHVDVGRLVYEIQQLDSRTPDTPRFSTSWKTG